jgi:hypothetical protein
MNRFQQFRCCFFLSGVFCLFLVIPSLGSADDPPSSKRAQSLEQLPDGENVLAGLREEHPRLLATAEDFVRLKKIVQENSTAKKWFEHLQADAEKLLKPPPTIQ